MTIQELKKGIQSGKIVTFNGKKVNLLSENGIYFSAISGNYFKYDIEFSNDFQPYVSGTVDGDKELYSFDLEHSGLELSFSGNISFSHIETKRFN